MTTNDDNEERSPSPRCATAADVPALARLEAACFADPWSADSLTAVLSDPLAACTVWEADGEVVSSLIGQRIPPEGEIWRVATLPAYRRRGYAARLLTALLSAWRREGCDRFYLEVRAANTAARALYAALGFREAGVRRRYYRNPTEDAVVLILTDRENTHADTGL